VRVAGRSDDRVGERDIRFLKEHLIAVMVEAPRVVPRRAATRASGVVPRVTTRDPAREVDKAAGLPTAHNRGISIAFA